MTDTFCLMDVLARQELLTHSPFCTIACTLYIYGANGHERVIQQAAQDVIP